MRGTPDRLVAGARADLARARGLARAQAAAAAAALQAAQRRLAATRRAALAVPARAAGTRDARLARLRAGHASQLAGLAAAAAGAAGRYAPGPAGAPWAGWVAGTGETAWAGEAGGTPPVALRVGDVELPGAPAVPAFLPLLDRAHLVLRGGDRAGTDAVVAALLLRALGAAVPGQVRLAGYDPDRLGGALAGFAPLAPAGLLTFVGPGGLAGLLDELVEHIRRINETVLAGEHASLAALAAATGRRPEPWRVAVLLGTGEQPGRHDSAQLDRILRTGVAAGVHLIVAGVAVPAPDPSTHSRQSTVETVRLGEGTHPAYLPGYGDLPVRLDPPPAELVSATCRRLAGQVLAGPVPVALAELLPPRWWTHSSGTGLSTPIGAGTDGREVRVDLGDFPPHALIGGPSGTGKTNLILAWLAGLATRYSPAELECYLLDFKEGVSFARFAPGRRDPSWLPQVRLVGVNVNTDREFGLALLRYLAQALRERAEAAKRAEVTTLAELRAEDPTGHWPRLVAVIDEFQVLLAGRDALAGEAVTRLEDLARRGRSQGIHLILASQDVSGIEALWGRGGLVAQFSLRIALPRARRILAENNTGAETIPRYHAVVNADSGAVPANQVVRVPSAGDRRMWSDVQQRLWRMRDPAAAPPRLFDGDAVPALAQAADLPVQAAPGTDPPAAPRALLGAAIDVRARSAVLRLAAAPGRNLAVLGTRVDEAAAILHAAALSLARQYPAGTARFTLACLDPRAGGAARALHAALPADTAWYEPDSIVDMLAGTAAGLGTGAGTGAHFLILYALDAASAALAVRAPGGSGYEHLRRILHSGPERHVHVLGWWRGVARLREDLGGVGARLDPIGAFVALDVHGSELGQLYPQPGGPAWHPRPWRGLYFDRAVHRTAEVIIPYG